MMVTSIMNIQFSYMYRDAGNFKNFGDVVFVNSNHLSLEYLNAKIKEALLDEMFFDAFAVGVPELFFDEYDEELDHDWHEFDQLVEVDNTPNDIHDRDIHIFISILRENPI